MNSWSENARLFAKRKRPVKDRTLHIRRITARSTDQSTEAGSSALPVIPPPPTAAAIPATNTDEASNASDALYEDPPSRPPSPFEEEIVVAMEAFDGLKGDIVEI